MSLSLGQTLAGLLNATFGNAVEIIVGITALLQDQIRIVQTSVRASNYFACRSSNDTGRCWVQSSPTFCLSLECPSSPVRPSRQSWFETI